MGWRRAIESLLHRDAAGPAARSAAGNTPASPPSGRSAVEPPEPDRTDADGRGEPDAAELAAALARLAESVEDLENALAGGRPKAAPSAAPSGRRGGAAAKPAAAGHGKPEPRRDLIESALTQRRRLSRQLEKLDPVARERLRVLAETMMLGKPPPGR